MPVLSEQKNAPQEADNLDVSTTPPVAEESNPLSTATINQPEDFRHAPIENSRQELATDSLFAEASLNANANFETESLADKTSAPELTTETRTKSDSLWDRVTNYFTGPSENKSSAEKSFLESVRDTAKSWANSLTGTVCNVLGFSESTRNEINSVINRSIDAVYSVANEIAKISSSKSTTTPPSSYGKFGPSQEIANGSYREHSSIEQSNNQQTPSEEYEPSSYLGFIRLRKREELDENLAAAWNNMGSEIVEQKEKEDLDEQESEDLQKAQRQAQIAIVENSLGNNLDNLAAVTEYTESGGNDFDYSRSIDELVNFAKQTVDNE